MRGIGRKMALAFECVLDPREHPVEGLCEAAKLIVWQVKLQPGMEILCPHSGGQIGNRCNRGERTARQKVTASGGQPGAGAG